MDYSLLSHVAHNAISDSAVVTTAYCLICSDVMLCCCFLFHRLEGHIGPMSPPGKRVLVLRR